MFSSRPNFELLLCSPDQVSTAVSNASLCRPRSRDFLVTNPLFGASRPVRPFVFLQNCFGWPQRTSSCVQFSSVAFCYANIEIVAATLRPEVLPRQQLSRRLGEGARVLLRNTRAGCSIYWRIRFLCVATHANMQPCSFEYCCRSYDLTPQ